MNFIVWIIWLIYALLVVPMIAVVFAGLFYGGIVKLLGA
jgi:hypothetical protein